MKMNKSQFKYTALTAVLALGVGTTIPFLVSNDEFHPERDSVRSQVSSFTVPLRVPAEVRFADEVIPLDRYDLRERMDRELMAFTYMHSSTMLTIKRANRYFPIIEPILKKNGLPDDLKYLAVIESSLNPLARSRAGAAGMWQFMKGTGRDFGLEVNANIDERYHIEKSTEAACDYLKQAYAKYGSWLCVAASYNAGQARITQQLSKQGVDRAVDLWLVEETTRYMFRLLAAKSVLGNPQQYGFLLKRRDLYPPIPCTTDTVTTGIADLAAYAKEKGITYAQLKDANPWLRDDFLQNKSGRTYVLKIPTRAGMYYDPKKTKAHNKAWVVD
ncbi:MAG TPA: lytic transglycosylase domain-containing protein [Candidatus Bacteroides pullicola]|uniref:Lytic transglycosylase domain-containing protein n=1 Tax=Candidatus Bacteroides pullicola TaxID=2838475 RepID=A0A9D1ZI47_9BACE|nr:lytic transglycosylase domain-containing protein [Candidatus Bacteroides pullicola]